MALPTFYRRSAVAVSHALHGYDEEAITRRLDDVTVGVAFGSDATKSAEGLALLDLVIRLVARFYPRLSILDGSGTDHGRELAELARSINPLIDLVSSDDASITVAAGAGAVAVVVGVGVGAAPTKLLVKSVVQMTVLPPPLEDPLH